MGKTRLALRVGNDLAAVFADGVTFVALAAIADPALAVPGGRPLGPGAASVGDS